MKMNRGHYVALLISTTLCHSHSSNNDKRPPKTTNTNVGPVRLTRIKLLRPTDALLLGHVYRLITTQEAMKGLCAKKHAKMKRNQQESSPDKPNKKAGQRSEPDKENKVNKHERQPARSTTSSNSAARSKTWQPSLQSISEAAS